MKVLMIATALDRPEVELYLGLVAKKIEVTLMTDPDGPYLEFLGALRDRIVPITFTGRMDFKAISLIRRTLRANEIELVHSFSAKALSNSLIAGIGLGIKHVTYRGTTGHLSRFDPSSWLAYLNPRIAKIICVSDAVLEYLNQSGIPQTRLRRIYKGHDIKWYQDMRTVSLHTLGIPHGSFIVACTANMREVKGVDVLVAAIDHIDPALNVHFLLIGRARDPLVLESARRSKQRDRLHFVGFRDDAIGLVRQAHVFCMPSRRREGFPKALVEAMILGVPVVVTRVGGMPELVKNNECGLVVEAEDPKAIAQAVSRLAADRELCCKFGEAARRRIMNDFSIENTITQTIQVYNEVLGQLQS